MNTSLSRLVLHRYADKMTQKLYQKIRLYCDKVDSSTPSVTRVVQGGEKADRLRVRRARPADVPRLLTFVQKHARAVWPGLVLPAHTRTTAAHVILTDHVARALAQGHSMIAEQLETKKGWSHVRGLAVAAAVCPWDAALLQQWAKCVLCSRSKKLMELSAHCLEAPALHDRYNAHNILQVLLLVPSDHPMCTQIIMNLMKSSIQRGEDVGISLIRFDVTNVFTAKVFDDMQLKKEWELNFHSATLEKESQVSLNTDGSKKIMDSFISVYTVRTNANTET